MIDLDKINKSLWESDTKKQNHFNVIINFLNYLNKKTDAFILKGGTSLMICYGLDRFSEDIDLDSRNPNIYKYISEFATMNGYTVRVAKDTKTTKRFYLHYLDNVSPLKIEISYRNSANINQFNCYKVNGVATYSLNMLCIFKTVAYLNRDKLRDLYDITYIYNHYKNELSPSTLTQFYTALSVKGLEQFDYLITTQDDELIDKDKLVDDFLSMYNSLNLLEDYSLTDDAGLSL